MAEEEKMAEELMKRAVDNINSKSGVLKNWGKIACAICILYAV